MKILIEKIVRAKTKIFITLALFFMLFVLLAIGIFINTQNEMERELATGDTLITIKKGSSFNQFSKLLVTKGWLENRFWLRTYVRLFPKHARIKSGTYHVHANMKLIDLLNLVVSGKEKQFTITFIEGSTFKQILAQLAQHPHITKHITEKSVADISKLLSIKQANPEGWFFPDTYAFTHLTSDIAILTRAHQKMKRLLIGHWNTRDSNLPYTSPYQALIMASIIEKESGKHAEQGIIASVFVNRMHKKMRLQTDPTVIYGLGERYNGDITYANLREKTAYNTYRIKGLPPTPIAMPSKKAIYAALHPESTNYLYFVSNGKGEHIFSENLSDHNSAVNKYQRNK